MIAALVLVAVLAVAGLIRLLAGPLDVLTADELALLAHGEEVGG